MRTTNSIAEATCALLRHYGWRRIAIVTNTGTVAYDRVYAFEEVGLHRIYLSQYIFAILYS